VRGYVDGGESAKSLNRPGMAKLLTLVDKGKVQAVIVAKLDRLTRSVKDLCSLLELFEKRGVALISVAKSLDTASAAGRLVITIMPASRSGSGRRLGNARGTRCGTSARAGSEWEYPVRRFSPDGRHVEPDPGEQGVLTEIRHLRQSGHTLRGIAAALNRKALRTRRGSAWRLGARCANRQAGGRSAAARNRPIESRGPFLRADRDIKNQHERVGSKLDRNAFKFDLRARHQRPGQMSILQSPSFSRNVSSA
jgi:site-specific DNA recombinase